MNEPSSATSNHQPVPQKVGAPNLQSMPADCQPPSFALDSPSDAPGVQLTPSKEKTATLKFEPMQCLYCGKSDIECSCSKNTRSIKSQASYYQRAGYPSVEMAKGQPPAILLFLLSRASHKFRNLDTVTIFHWVWLDLHLDCGVWGDGGNGWYEWFVLEKMPDGSYRLETSDMGYGATAYCLKTVLQKMDGRGCL